MFHIKPVERVCICTKEADTANKHSEQCNKAFADLFRNTVAWVRYNYDSNSHNSM